MNENLLNKYVQQYIHSIYKGEQCITVGQVEDGNYFLHVGGNELPQDFKSLLITEEVLIALIASTMIYFEHYGIDLSLKIKELINTQSITYTFPSNEQD